MGVGTRGRRGRGRCRDREGKVIRRRFCRGHIAFPFAQYIGRRSKILGCLTEFVVGKRAT